MTSLDDVLAPGRATEALVRRAARGHRPAWRVLFDHLPEVIRAEGRWLYPVLLRRLGTGADRAWLLPAGCEHEQILELLDRVGPQPAHRGEAMFVAAQALLVVHVRAERDWLCRAFAGHPTVDEPPLARYLNACRPLLQRAAQLA